MECKVLPSLEKRMSKELASRRDLAEVAARDEEVEFLARLNELVILLGRTQRMRVYVQMRVPMHV